MSKASRTGYIKGQTLVGIYMFAYKFINNNLFFILIVLFALLARLAAFPAQSGDYTAFIGPWYDFIKANGAFHSLKYNFFLPYAPSYIYLLILVSLLPIQKIVAIKLISVFFDIVLAMAVKAVVMLITNNKQLSRLFFFDNIVNANSYIEQFLLGSMRRNIYKFRNFIFAIYIKRQA